jgi:multidrug resistance efflux pump
MENMDVNDGLKIYSEEVRDVLSDPPKAILRWGNSIVLGFVTLLLFLSWFIKYPDIVAAPIVITTNIPPEKIIAKTTGKIEAILVQDKAAVNENTPLAIIQNSADYKAVLQLSHDLSKEEKVSTVEIIKKHKTANLGEVQQAFSLFEKESMAHDLNQELQPYQVQSNAQNAESIEIVARLTILQQQKSLNESELQLQKKDLNRQETLFDKGIISAQDFETKKLGYIQSEKNYQNVLSSISQLKSSLIANVSNSKNTRISNTKENVTLESSQTQSFYNLKKVIKDWELAYVLQSSVAGKVSFLQIWTANQSIMAGESVFAIIPTLEKGYIGKLKAAALNSGKIKIGQSVNIRLTNFPDSQYGMLQGKIKNISLTPDKDGNVLIDVVLPKKLETSYHKTIAFQQEMSGSAEIITEDLRLIERLLYQFRAVFRR